MTTATQALTGSSTTESTAGAATPPTNPANGARDRGGIEELLGEDERDGDAVGDEILAAHPLLAAVGRRTEPERAIDRLEVEALGVTLEDGPELGRGVEQRRGQDGHRRARGGRRLMKGE